MVLSYIHDLDDLASLSGPVDMAEIHKSSTMSFFNSVPERRSAAEVIDLA